MTWTLRIAATDLYEALDTRPEQRVTKAAVEHNRDRLFDYVAARTYVAQRAERCLAVPRDLGFLDTGTSWFAVVTLAYHCPRWIDQVTLRYDLFFDLDPRHQGLAHFAFYDEEGHETVFRASARSITLSRTSSRLAQVRDYTLLGIEHIFTGYDHLAFLLGLLVVAARHGLRRGARAVVRVVTGFTLAHSLTLIASALGWIALRPALVEPAIALSIAYVGIENLVRSHPPHRFFVSFGFGLVHGFGFASVLKEAGLPERGLLWSLVSFNGGVELGQLAVVLLVLPVLAQLSEMAAARVLAPTLVLAAVGLYLLLDHFSVASVQLSVVCFAVAPVMTWAAHRFGYDRVVRRGGSLALTVLAIFWFFERTLGTSWLRGNLG